MPLALVACAASPPPAASSEVAPAGAAAEPEPPPPPTAPVTSKEELSSPEAAEAELLRAETALFGAMPVTGDMRVAEAGAGADAEQKAPRKPAATPAQPSPLSASGGASACEGACRAYSSMQRAASRLCELAGKEDARCAAAQGKVERATERLKASCPACEGIRG
ncbi:hypothetical protein [Polyangium spumosum]|uniref:hypothetical protein n=1 Tax=Polyangium spumosum TaxID=889282 RepID=UPI00147890AB|nr:hypothetical protein [Polyangium spumosum]